MKSKIYIITIICLLLSAVTVYAAESDQKMVLSKEDVIELAFKNNHDIIKLEKDLEIAEEGLKGVKANFYPKISLNTIYTINSEQQLSTMSKDSYTFDLGLQQPLFMGGQIIAGYEQVKKNFEMNKLQLEDKKQEIRNQVLNQYYQILQSKKMLEVNQQNISTIERYLEIAQIKKEVGIMTNTDVLRAQIDLNKGKQSLLQIKNSLKLSKLRLKNDLGIRKDIKLILDDELTWQEVNLTEAEVREYAFANRLDLQILDLREDVLELEIDKAKGTRYPTLNLSSNYSTMGDSLKFDDGNFKVSLMLSYDIFDGGAKDSKVEQAKKELEQFNITEEQTVNNIGLAIQESLLKVSETREYIELAELSLTQAKENLRQNEIQYQEGLLSSFYVLEAQSTFKQAQTEYYKAVYNYNLAVANLERVMGESAVISEE